MSALGIGLGLGLRRYAAAGAAPGTGPFPEVEGTATSFRDSDGTTATILLPADIEADETLLVIMRSSLGTTDHTYPENWVRLFSDDSDLSDDRFSAAWRKATGAEGASIELTIASGKFAAIAYRISGGADPTVRAPEYGGLAVGADTSINPGALTPTGGSKKYLWIWAGGAAGEQTSPPASNPANYTNPIGVSSGTVGSALTNCMVCSAQRQLEADSENPGGWTQTGSPDWCAVTIAVHPT